MKTLTITISDEAARQLDKSIEGTGVSAEQAASRAVEDAFDEDWGDLSPEDIAAIQAGLEDFERGDVVPHEEVVAELKQKYGW